MVINIIYWSPEKKCMPVEDIKLTINFAGFIELISFLRFKFLQQWFLSFSTPEAPSFLCILVPFSFTWNLTQALSPFSNASDTGWVWLDKLMIMKFWLWRFHICWTVQRHRLSNSWLSLCSGLLQCEQNCNLLFKNYEVQYFTTKSVKNTGWLR